LILTGRKLAKDRILAEHRENLLYPTANDTPVHLGSLEKMEESDAPIVRRNFLPHAGTPQMAGWPIT
jgi:hypothetical protein